jgi:hypothetical protein
MKKYRSPQAEALVDRAKHYLGTQVAVPPGYNSAKWSEEMSATIDLIVEAAVLEGIEAVIESVGRIKPFMDQGYYVPPGIG